MSARHTAAEAASQFRNAVGFMRGGGRRAQRALERHGGTAARHDATMTTAQIVTLVLTSGLLAGITSAATQLWVARRAQVHSTTEREAQQRFNLEERDAQREHEATLRREEAHDSARSTFLPMAESVERWIDAEYLREHQDKVGSFYPPPGNAPVLPSVSDALDQLSSIRVGHPTKSVRVAAGDLRSSIQGRFGEVDNDGPSTPELEDWRHWDKAINDLVEAIHTQIKGASSPRREERHVSDPPD